MDSSNSPARVPSDTDFVMKTNREYAEWCALFYQADALDGRGMASLHGLWAWREQERRRMSADASKGT